MDKNRKAPRLRFPGFTDDWEQRKLGDVATLTSSKRVHASDYADNGIPFFRGSEISKLGENTELEDVLYISEELYEQLKRNYGVPKENDILITAVGTLGNTFVIKGNTPFYFKDGNLIWLKDIQINSDYLGVYIGDGIGKQRVLNSAAGSNQKALTMVKLNEVVIDCPSEAEQKVISSFFSNLDNLITLHQRKCDKLVEYKKGMLQKMFPQNGASVPEIRFPGFTGDWERRKFGDVFEEYSEKKHEELPPLTIIQGGGTILREESDRALQYDKANLSGYKMVKKDDFIVHLRSFEGGLEKANSDGIISPAYHTFHGDNTDSRFYYPFFRSKTYINVLLKPHVYGIRDGRSIDIDGMKSILIPVPKYEEQKQIGDFFETLDNLITLNQRKLETIKEYKKGLLNQMFI